MQRVLLQERKYKACAVKKAVKTQEPGKFSFLTLFLQSWAVAFGGEGEMFTR